MVYFFAVGFTRFAETAVFTLISSGQYWQFAMQNLSYRTDIVN